MCAAMCTEACRKGHEVDGADVIAGQESPLWQAKVAKPRRERAAKPSSRARTAVPRGAAAGTGKRGKRLMRRPARADTALRGVPWALEAKHA
jgi:hypothetical protein